MDHAVRSTRQHHLCFAATDNLGRFADRLATGGTGGQAICIGTLSVEHRGHMTDWHIWFLFQFQDRVENFQSTIHELDDIQIAGVVQAGRHHVGEAGEILIPFATAHVHAETTWVLDRVQHARTFDRLFGSAGGELGVSAAVLPQFSRFTGVSDIPILDLCRNLGGKATSVEDGGIVDSAFPLFQVIPNGFDIITQWVCLLYTSPSPRDRTRSRMPSSA